MLRKGIYTTGMFFSENGTQYYIKEILSYGDCGTISLFDIKTRVEFNIHVNCKEDTDNYCDAKVTELKTNFCFKDIVFNRFENNLFEIEFIKKTNGFNL